MGLGEFASVLMIFEQRPKGGEEMRHVEHPGRVF